MNFRITPKWLRKALTVLIVGALVAICLQAWQRSGAEVYRTFPSPDNHFQIVVFRNPAKLTMPGQGSDASGYFQLRDSRSCQVLNESPVEMVQLVDQVEWSSTSVNVRLLANWSLPQ